MGKQYVYSFREVKNANSEESVFRLGNKGAQLAEMVSIGLPVPPGFQITTEACREFYDLGKKWPKGLEEQVKKKLSELEKKLGKKFGDMKNPLFVSVRSGSYVSMPGMMDTVLNLGMNDETVVAFAKKTGNERSALDSYRRFIHMFGDVVMGVEHAKFEEVLHRKKETKGVQYDTELTADDLREVISDYKQIVKKETGKMFPSEPWEQLKMGIGAVFSSWNTPRAISYRRINKLRSDAGTGVTVQSMVFGNMGETSGTGVSFTRNPSTGKKEHYGEFLINAQGEDVVAGIRTPKPIDELGKILPDVYRQLLKVYDTLEKHYKDLQDFEFTIEDRKLFLLQTRSGKRTAHAAVKVAVDMVGEGLITKEKAVMMVKPDQLNQLLHKQLDPVAKKAATVIASGLPASPGAAVGKIVFTAERAMELAKEDEHEKLVLVRLETSPEDIEGMHIAQGILTGRGGMTCVGGDSLLLTKNGFFTAETLFTAIENGEKPKILSFDSAEMGTRWKSVIAAGKRRANAISANFSQSGRAKGNLLTITPEHKMMLIQNRKLTKKALENVLKDNEFVSIVDKIPFEAKNHDAKFAYLVGAISTDGNVNLTKRRGRVTFTQKDIPSKARFIQTVNQYFLELFGYEMKQRIKTSNCFLGGRQISGTATDLMCNSKEVTTQFMGVQQALTEWVLDLDEISTLNFLAGAIDGDGTFSNNRIQIYVSKENLAQAIVASCLKLGIVPQVSVNRNIYNIQIVEKMNEILTHSKRLVPKAREKIYESKLFSTKQLLSDIIAGASFHSNSKQRIKDGIRRNLLFGKGKFELYLSRLSNSSAKEEIEKILNSDIRMYRAEKMQDVGEQTVYNFEVDSVNELDKNFVVFTKRYTPVLVSNSHAAVVARGMGKPCVAGCSDININETGKYFTVKTKEGELKFKELDWISLDGGMGEVFGAQLPLVVPSMSGDFGTLMKWADSFRRLGIRTNADTPKDAQVAKDFGAEGIGLCRTEHMFFEGDRIKAMREMILAEDTEGRKKALAKLLPFQKEDFKGLFRVMSGMPIIIRFLDPPLHEFLPKEEKDIQGLAQDLGISAEKIKQTITSLHEFNPMLGFRGCRLGVVYPEISEMQARAIFEAALEAQKEGYKPVPEIEVPNVITVKEFKIIKEIIMKAAKDAGILGKIKFSIGTMIEFPRAVIVADELAAEADFFSFGTNDLTQTTLGFSRDDAGKFIPIYVEKGALEQDPFQTIDQTGVGKLMIMTVEKGRAVKKDLDIGICGEHGGEPASVEFCHKIGLSNVSCSPYRVPIARLAAAQAAIKEKQQAARPKKKGK